MSADEAGITTIDALPWMSSMALFVAARTAGEQSASAAPPEHILL